MSAANAGSVVEVHYTMGTYFTITVQGVRDAAARRAMRRCFTDARRIEAVFSRYDRASELSRLNAARADSTSVSDEIAELLRRALALREVTGGTFDVTIGALTALWRGTSVWPVTIAHGEQPARVQLRGHELTRIDPDVQLDFDGLAKGYAVDRCVALLRAGSIPRALVNLGDSSQYALGAPKGQNGWRITVRADDDTTIGTVRLRDQALSASSVFGHSRTIGGQRIGHIIDPVNGQPLRAKALALVVADTATDAEAFSKAVLIWGARDRRAAPASPLRKVRAVRHVQAALYVEDGDVATWRAGAMHFAPAARPIDASEEPLR